MGEVPTAALMAAISRGEQTIAPAPAFTAIVANPTAESSALCLNPILVTSSSHKEVKIVTPVMWVPGEASTAALIIASPPDA